MDNESLKSLSGLLHRPRRNRKTSAMRRMVRENILTVDNLIAPLFVIEGENKKVDIPSMPNQFRLSIDELMREVGELYELGIPCVSLFPALASNKKDKYARESVNNDGLLQKAIAAVKKNYPDILVMTDVAMDPYSSDGHDGFVDDMTGEIVNDESVKILGAMALSQAMAGSDIIGPSDMMDGRVGYIRRILDEHGFKNCSIMSYTAKYASHFYGPFREALDSAPKSQKGGDKKSYQMDSGNHLEAIREAQLDTEEGADILMVKPGLPYLDIIRTLKDRFHLPIAAYNVSGEYAMIKAAEEKGWLNGEACMMEMLTSFKRAGASMILTYFAKEAAGILKQK